MQNAVIRMNFGCCVKSMALKSTNDMSGTNGRAVGPSLIL